MKFSMRYILMALAIRTYIICHLTLLWYYRTTIVLCNFDWYTWLHQISLNFPMSRNARSMYIFLCLCYIHYHLSPFIPDTHILVHFRHYLTGFRSLSATVVSAEPFSHGTGTLRCLQKEMATYRNWSVSLWRDPDDVSHCRILSRQNWMATYLGYTLRMKTLFRGWPVTVHVTVSHFSLRWPSNYL